MKKQLPIFLIAVKGHPLAFILYFLMPSLQAQPTSDKIGFANIEYIFSQLPESKQIEANLKSMQTQLKNQLDAKAEALQKRYDTYVANVKTMTAAVKLKAEEELQMLEDDYQQSREDAVKTLESKQAQLVSPVLEKIRKAIEVVAMENGFKLVINLESNGQFVVLYGDESLDVSDLVVARLKK